MSRSPFETGIALGGATESGQAVIAALRALGWLQPRSYAIAIDDIAELPMMPDGVGVWRRTGDGGFTRDLLWQAQFGLWADVETIPPKRDRKRVVLVGESVARGYLYDPIAPFSSFLGQALSATPGTPFELIDLARNNLAFEGQLATLGAQALALEPDLFVVYAGNNRPVPRHVAFEPEGIEALERDGVRGFAAHLQRRVRTCVADAVGWYARSGIPCVFVIPESNLTHWQYPDDVPVPWLRGNDTQDWLDAREELQRAIADDDASAIARLAERLELLDGGTTRTPPHARARAALAARRWPEARALLDRANDSMLWDTNSRETPHIRPSVRDAMRDAARAKGHAVVVVRDVLETLGDGGQGDAAHFIDYCHHNARAMRAIAVEVTRVVGERAGIATPDRDRLLAAVSLPSAQVEAEVHFLAAIHSCHAGNQNHEFVAHLCEQAIRHDPKIASAFQSFAAVSSRSDLPWMSESWDALLALPSFARYAKDYFMPMLDPMLIDTMKNACDEWQLDLMAGWAEPFESGAWVDLLADYYAPHLMERNRIRAGQLARGDRLVVCGPTNEFWCVLPRAGCRLELELVIRQVDAVSSRVTFDLGGAHVLVPVTSTWQRQRVVLETGQLAAGPHRLTLSWRGSLPASEAHTQAAAAELRHGHHADLAPRFGELLELRARVLP